MVLFARNKRDRLQGFIARVLNNNCPELRALIEGPRLDGRANLTLPIIVVPVEGGRPVVGRAFPALTKDFSGTGISIVLTQPKRLGDLIVAIRWDGEMYYLRGEARHLHPLGAGFHQLGVDLREMVYTGDVPSLAGITY